MRYQDRKDGKMLSSLAGRAMRFMKGMAVFGGAAFALALVLGVGTVALAAVPGDPLRLGQNNAISNALTALGGTRAGGAMVLIDNNSSATGSRALDLRTQPSRAPLTVNADAGRAVNLDADRLDGRSAEQLGVNGLERTFDQTGINSASPKTADARCPTGKVVVGTGYDVVGGKNGSSPDVEANVVVNGVIATETAVFVDAVEEEPFAGDWFVIAQAICARAP